MNIRCSGCHSSVWLEPSRRPRDIVCHMCGEVFRVETGLDGEQAALLHIRARRFARRNGIDIPAAKSVLLKVMTLQQVRDVARLPCPSADPEAQLVDYDSTFQPALDAGLLSPRQAYERGIRAVYSEVIAYRHGIPLELAEEVADNRVCLLEAIRSHRALIQHATEIKLPPIETRTSGAPGVAILIMILAGGLAVRQSSEQLALAPPAPTADEVPVSWEAAPEPGPQARHDTLLASSEVVRGEGDAIVEVTGPNPDSVLEAYCEADPMGRLKPVRVVPNVPPSPFSRLGVVQNLERPHQDETVVIKRDQGTGRWYAGDGERAILPRSAVDDVTDSP